MVADVRAVLFDLDGTLLDTAPDLAAALNRVRADDGVAPLPYSLIRPHVSNGSFALIRLAFDYAESSCEFESRRQRLLTEYHANVAVESRLFEGMDEVLHALESSRRPWGIVTNKPAWLTDPLLAATGLDRRAACVVSGDTTAHSKPHPEPLLCAAKALATAPSECLYVGDAERDVIAADAAGMPIIVALYGYIAAGEQPQNWPARGRVTTPLELMRWF